MRLWKDDKELHVCEGHQGVVYSVSFHSDGKTVATPCVPLAFALSKQLDRIRDEGLENRWARHRGMQAATAAWANEHGFTFFVDEPSRSPTVSALNASGRDVMELAAKARAAGFAMDKGYGKLKGQAFRLGHMGDHTVAGLQRLLAALV